MKTQSILTLILSGIVLLSGSAAFAKQDEATGQDLADVMGDTASCLGSAAVDYAAAAEKQRLQQQQELAIVQARQSAALTALNTSLTGVTDKKQKIQIAAKTLGITSMPETEAQQKQVMITALRANFGVVLNENQLTVLNDSLFR